MYTTADAAPVTALDNRQIRNQKRLSATSRLRRKGIIVQYSDDSDTIVCEILVKKLSSFDIGTIQAGDRDLVIATPIKIALMTIRQGRRQSTVDFSPRNDQSGTKPCHLFVLWLVRRDSLDVGEFVA
jgi:hypothetical protein